MSSFKQYRLRLCWRLAALLLSVLAAGCADIVPANFEPISPTVARLCHEHITISGRFSAQYQKDGKEESVHGNFEWIQSGTFTNVNLLSPLGQTIATIAITPSIASLTPAGKPPRLAADADALTVATLGWALPVSGLGRWMQGCALDRQGSRFNATQKHNSVITPDGWHLNYPSWVDDARTGQHPRLIDLHRPTDRDASAVTLRLVIDTWQPSDK